MTIQVILETLQHQGAAMITGPRFQFVEAQPQGAMNITIQFLFGIMLGHLATKTIADIGIALNRMLPAIDADQRFGFKLPGCFFLGFTNHGVDQTFVWLEMTGGLVERHLAVDFLFD